MKPLYLSLLLCLSMVANAGTYPFYYYFTQHTQNQLLYNPAYAGTSEKLNLHLRTMNGFYSRPDGKPLKPLNHGYAAFDMPCNKLRGVWGVYSIIDRPELKDVRNYNLSVGANYAYRWQVNDDHRLQFGAGVSYRRQYLEYNSLVFGVLYQPDEEIRNANNYMDFSLGTWYQFKDLNVGLSVTHLGRFPVSKTFNALKYQPVFNFYGAYKVHLSKAFNLEPYLYFSTAGLGDPSRSAGWGEEFQAIVGFMADYKETVFLGLAYNHGKVLSPTAGVQIKKKVRLQGTYNTLLNQPDESGYLHYHNFELSLTVQLTPKERTKKEKS